MPTKMLSIDIISVCEGVTAKYEAQGYTPYEINNGQCCAWADEVFDLLGQLEHVVEYWETPSEFSDTDHAFLRINGLFVDAECMTGVAKHSDLPIFKKLPSKQPVWLVDITQGAPYRGKSRIYMTKRMVLKYDEINGTDNATRT